MAKFMEILIITFLAIVLCAAETTSSRTSPRFQVKRNRFLARQEVETEPAVVTPYPSADELKPAVPFDEAVAAEGQSPHQPDEIYGPPEQELPVQTDDIALVEKDISTAEEEEEEETAVAEEEEQVAEELAVASSRLSARKNLARSAKLHKAAPAKLLKITPARLQLQPQFVQQPLFYYVSQ